MRKLLAYTAFVAHIFAAPAFAEERLFDGAEPLPIEIQADFAAMTSSVADKKRDNPATLKVGGETIAVDLRERGNLRRFICRGLPPFKIVLPKGKEKKGPLFRGLDRDLKFVTHCTLETEPEEQARTLREYVQYKLLAAAGISTFRVRLADTTYKNPAGEVISRGTGFFIEHVKDLMQREGITQQMSPPPLELLEARVLLANSFLRNVDFWVPTNPKENAHNVEPVFNSAGKPLILIPYDFDLTGVALRNYGVPNNSHYGFTAFMRTTDAKRAAGQEVMRQFVGREDALLGTIGDSPLSDEDKKQMRDWTRKFLKQLKQDLE